MIVKQKGKVVVVVEKKSSCEQLFCLMFVLVTVKYWLVQTIPFEIIYYF